MKKKHWIIKQQEDAELVFSPDINYDKENDILYITWFPQFDCKYSIETKKGFIFDLSEEDEIKGIEIMNFMKKVKKVKKN